MSNPQRNEKLLKVGGRDILLRPTFQNIASLEGDLGGLPFIAWKFTRQSNDGKNMAGMSDIAKVIFHCQAGDGKEGKLSLDEVWQLCLVDGVKLLSPTIEFLASITSGNPLDVPPSEKQKKS